MNRIIYTFVFISFSFISDAVGFNPVGYFLSNRLVCPNTVTVQNFNISNWGSGQWHEIARYPNTFEIITRCITVDNKYKDRVVRGSVINMPPTSIYTIDTELTYATENEDGRLDLKVRYSWPTIHIDIPLKVLAFEYDRYIIFHACFRDRFTRIMREFVWIFARNRILEGDDKIDVENALKSLDTIIDRSRLIWIDQTVESCNENSLRRYFNPSSFLAKFLN